MYTATIAETFGPFFGAGGYGTVTGKATHRSAKTAIRLARLRMRENMCEENMGGGVPVLSEFVLKRGNKTLIHRFG